MKIDGRDEVCGRGIGVERGRAKERADGRVAREDDVVANQCWPILSEFGERS